MSDNTIDMDELKRRMDGALSAFRSHLSSLRTGRASANLVEPILVEAYGQQMPMNQVGTISVPEPRLITIQVWDKSMIGNVEKAIRDADLGLNPVVDGVNLRIPLPELNEERRQELVKVAHKYAEDARVAVRHVRRDGMDMLKSAMKAKEIGEDEQHTLSDQVQKATDEKIADVERILSQKEAEIMQV